LLPPHHVDTSTRKHCPSGGVDIWKPLQLEEETFINIKYTLRCSPTRPTTPFKNWKNQKKTLLWNFRPKVILSQVTKYYIHVCLKIHLSLAIKSKPLLTLECCRAKWILSSPYLKVGSDRQLILDNLCYGCP